MFRMLSPLLAVFCLMLTALVAVPPATAQSRSDIPIERAEGELRERLLNAARVQGLRLGDGARVQVSTSDCPTNCNGNVGGGICYCGLDDEGNCPSGTTRTREPRADRACRTLPTTAAVVGSGIPPRTVLRP